jgi:hypothetical protein
LKKARKTWPPKIFQDFLKEISGASDLMDGIKKQLWQRNRTAHEHQSEPRSGGDARGAS